MIRGTLILLSSLAPDLLIPILQIRDDSTVDSEVADKEDKEKIKKSSLSDFEKWVKKCSDEMNKAAGQGDMRAVYEGVNALAQKQSKPPCVEGTHQAQELGVYTSS